MICPLGYRIVGSVSGPRRLVDAAAALAAHASCDERADVYSEAYLSAFQFNDEMRDHIDRYGSTASYKGPCWSPWIRFDIDQPNLELALDDARRLAICLNERYKLACDVLLIYFSGSKGFHVELPTPLWLPEPSIEFHRIAQCFAINVVDAAGVTIDRGVYVNIQAFRAPNSRHPKTGLHKRRLMLDELLHLPLERIVELARTPSPFDLPEPPNKSDLAAGDWQAAVEDVARENEAKKVKRATTNGAPMLNRSTLEFIRDGADEGNRHRMIFSAAANLAEFGCPPALAHALLSESGRDSGLPPKEVWRQIERGLEHLANMREGGGR